MPTITEEGDVISTALSVFDGAGEADSLLFNEFRLLKGQIQRIYTIDDSFNDATGRPGIYTLYDVLIQNPDGSTVLMQKCRMLQPGFGGGLNNFFEVVPNNPGEKAKNGRISINAKRGSHVLVASIAGQKNAGVIIGCLPHPSPVAVKQRPLKSYGSYLRGEFQGTNFRIRNDGSFRLVFNGPRNDNGVITSTNGPTAIEIDGEGNIIATTNADQTIKIDRVTKQVEVINGTTFIKMEQDGSKISGGADSFDIKANKDVKIDCSGPTTIKSVGDVTVSSASKIMLAKGDTTPSEPFVLGNKFVDFMKEFIDVVAEIKHIGNLGSPTPPPLNASAIKALKGKLEDLLSKLIAGDP